MAAEITFADVDLLVGAATPHFALQLRDRLDALIAEIPDGTRLHAYAVERRAEMQTMGQHGGQRVTNAEAARRRADGPAHH